MQTLPLGNTEMVAPMISRVSMVLVAVQALVFLPSCAQGMVKTSPIEVLGITLGDSTLHDVLRSLGPPDAVFLESQDSEGEEPVASDSLILRLMMPFPLASQEYLATVDFILEPTTYKVVAVGVNFVNSETADSNVPCLKSSQRTAGGTGSSVKDGRICPAGWRPYRLIALIPTGKSSR